jgi:hypothetical protein
MTWFGISIEKNSGLTTRKMDLNFDETRKKIFVAKKMDVERRRGYDRKYREMHGDRVRASTKACYLKHHEEYKANKRARYQLEKEQRSEASKADVKGCPICQIQYKRNYLKKHMMNRHKLTEEELPEDLCVRGECRHLKLAGGTVIALV